MIPPYGKGHKVWEIIAHLTSRVKWPLPFNPYSSHIYAPLGIHLSPQNRSATVIGHIFLLLRLCKPLL